MLLTGFDTPRLKKQYLARMIKAHNLLQTLTRVNRPYKGYHYGYVVDLQISKMSLIKQIKHILMNFNLNLEMRYKTIVIFSRAKKILKKI